MGIELHIAPALLIYGAGGHGLVIAEAAAAGSWNVEGFIDDSLPAGSTIGRWRVLGGPGLLIDRTESRFIIGIGDNCARTQLMEKLSAHASAMQTVIHPTAIVSDSVRLGPGAFVSANAVVNAQAQIETGAIINTAAVVEHHCRIGAAAHIGPRAVLCGNVTVGARSLVGAGAVVIPGITIGDDAIIGAGAVVIRDVASGQKVAGNPARSL